MNNYHSFEHVSLRPATDDDKTFARRVHHRAYYDVVVRQFGNWDEAEQDAYFEITWSKYASEIILWDNKLCGYWSVESTRAEIHLHQLLILPEYQGRGIGSYLLKSLIDRSLDDNILIRLQVFRESEARKLYIRMGFVQIDQSDDHIIMQLYSD